MLPSFGIFLKIFSVSVYDLTVEDEHCFFANGILVHNCHDCIQAIALEARQVTVGRSFLVPDKEDMQSSQGIARPLKVHNVGTAYS